MPYGLLTRRPATCRRVFVLCHALCVLFFTFYLFSVRPALSSPGGWAATYGGDGFEYAHSIRQTSDGGYIVAGRIRPLGDKESDVLVLRLKLDGIIEWQKTYGGVKGDMATSIQQTSDGGYVVTGHTYSFGAGEADAWVLKLRSDGTVEWQKTYGGVKGDAANSIQQARDGGYIVAGQTESFGAGRQDAWVLKLRPDGTVEWQKTYGGDINEQAFSIQQTSDGGYVVAGLMSSFGAGSIDFWVMKLRVDGTVEWQKTYGGVEEDVIHSIHQTRDGGYIVAGVTASFNAERGYEVWVLKLKPDGTVEWQKTYGGRYYSEARSILQTRDGGYIMAGCTMSSSIRETDFWVLKLKPDGTVEWQKAYGDIDEDIAESIQQTSDGGYIVAGFTRSFGAGERDAWILKLRPDGSIDPSCGFMRDTGTSGVDSNATILDAPASVRDSNACTQDSLAPTSTVDVTAHLLYPKTVD